MRVNGRRFARNLRQLAEFGYWFFPLQSAHSPKEQSKENCSQSIYKLLAVRWTEMSDDAAFLTRTHTCVRGNKANGRVTAFQISCKIIVTEPSQLQWSCAQIGGLVSSLGLAVETGFPHTKKIRPSCRGGLKWGTKCIHTGWKQRWRNGRKQLRKIKVHEEHRPCNRCPSPIWVSSAVS